MTTTRRQLFHSAAALAALRSSLGGVTDPELGAFARAGGQFSWRPGANTPELEAGHPAVAALVLFSSLLAVVYVWRVVEILYFREPPERELRLDWGAFLPAAALLIVSIVIGVWNAPLTTMVRAAAQQLMEANP